MDEKTLPKIPASHIYKKIGDFEVEQSLGRGATAQVFQARHVDTGAIVALKVFHPGLWDQSTFRRRALEEYRTVSSLQHPNIVSMLEPLWDSDYPSVAMEYVEGASLEDFQARLPYILPEVAVLVLIEVLEALEHAHEKGVTHRDLKPGNILVRSDGHVFVSDFGLAKMADVTRFTLSGAILGSPDFMAPEQARGDLTTPRSDLFSAASVLYFLVTGTRPFSRHSPLATLAAVIDSKYEPVQNRNPKVSPELVQLIHRGLARDADQRFATALDFKTALKNYLDSLQLTSDFFTLKLWVASPSDTTMTALQTISSALIEKCERAAVEENWSKVLETLSHLSLVAPESAAIPRLKQLYENMRKKKKAWKVALPAFLTLLGLVGGGKWLWSVLKQQPEPVSMNEKISTPTAPMVSKPEAITVSAVHKPAPVSTLSKKGRVRFLVPDGVKVYWDGELQRRTSIEASLGEHELRLVKTGNPPIVENVVVRMEEPTVIQVK